MKSAERPAVIGLMADSHGQPGTIAAAVACLNQRRCTQIFHLGDICDSFQPDSALACIELLQAHRIQALKGNNDHTMAVNLAGHNDQALQTVARFLHALPLIRYWGDAVLTHSLPFVDELGPVALIGTMGKPEAQRFFAGAPQALLFRGHGHAPTIMWQNAGEIVTTALAPRDTVDLNGRRPCVVTCGALTSGYCMIWNPETSQLTCLGFKPV